MSDEKYTNGDVIDRIEQEGIGYAIMHYMDSSHIKDPETVRLWDNASNALSELVTYLERDTGREVDG